MVLVVMVTVMVIIIRVVGLFGDVVGDGGCNISAATVFIGIAGVANHPKYFGVIMKMMELCTLKRND